MAGVAASTPTHAEHAEHTNSAKLGLGLHQGLLEERLSPPKALTPVPSHLDALAASDLVLLTECEEVPGGQQQQLHSTAAVHNRRCMCCLLL